MKRTSDPLIQKNSFAESKFWSLTQRDEAAIPKYKCRKVSREVSQREKHRQRGLFVVSMFAIVVALFTFYEYEIQKVKEINTKRIIDNKFRAEDFTSNNAHPYALNTHINQVQTQPNADIVANHFGTLHEDVSLWRKQVLDTQDQATYCWEQSHEETSTQPSHMQTFKMHNHGITFAQWLDLNTILTTDRRGNAGRSDLNTGHAKILSSDEWEYPVTIWNPVGTYVLTYEDLDDEPAEHKSKVRDFATGKSVYSFDFPIASAVWLENVLVLQEEEGQIALYDPKTFAKLRVLIGNPADSMTTALSKGNFLAVGFLEGDVYVWNLVNAAVKEPLAHYSPQNAMEEWAVSHLAWLTNNEEKGDGLLIIGNHATIYWGVEKNVVHAHYGSDSFTDAALSPDGRWLAVADFRSVHVFDVANDSADLLLPEHADTVQGVTWGWKVERIYQNRSLLMGLETDSDLSQRLLLLTWSGDGTARVWDWQSHEQIDLLFGGGPINVAALSPNGEQLLTASTSGTLRVWATGFRYPNALTKRAISINGTKTCAEDSHLYLVE